LKNWVNFVADNALIFFIFGFIITAVSLFFVKNLNIEAFPDPSPPVIEIVTIYPGKSAEEIERQVTIPLEISLAGMRGLKRINTISLYGLSDIKCSFSYDVTYREARQEVINRLANTDLPPGVSPSIIPNPIGEVLRYAVIGNKNLIDLRTIQDWTVARYLKTAGV
jgi:cobalt-zinc-cadmium resistance protein CzcA